MNEVGKANLQNAASLVYRHYLVLDKFREHLFDFNGKSSTFQNFIAANLEELNRTGFLEATVNNKKIRIELNRDKAANGVVGLAITSPDVQKEIPNLKKPKAYTADNQQDSNDLLTCICNTELGLKIEEDRVVNAAPFVYSGRKNKPGYYFGGPEKIELYTSHLNVVYNFIQHLQNNSIDSTTLNNVLIALPTGSGKTFIQALWFTILYHAEIDGAFALPGNLAEQFLKDFRKILPAEFVELIQPISKIGERNGEYYIGSHQDVLSTYLQEVKDSPDMLISIDEQHKAMEIEAQKIAVKELANEHICTYLTATPDEATFKMCGEPLIVMSNIEKKESGQGDFSRINVIQTKNVDEMRVAAACGHGVLSNAADVLDQHAVSTVTSLAADLPFRFEYQNEENKDPANKRWNFVPVMSRKVLVCASENVDDLINIHRVTHQEGAALEHQLSNLYSDGNVRHREATYEILKHDTNMDESFIKDYIKQQRREIQQQFIAQQNVAQAVVPKALPWFDMESALDNTMFHGLMDLALRGILSYNNDPKLGLKQFEAFSQIELNKQRKQNLSELTKQFFTKLRESGSGEHLIPYFYQLLKYDENSNKNGIDEAGAMQVARILELMVRKIRENYAYSVSIDQRKVVDNWALDSEVKLRLTDANSESGRELSEYLKTYYDLNRTFYVMSGFSRSETAIEDGRPFRSFNCHIEEMTDEDGNRSDKIKNRFLSASEALGALDKEYQYSPAYCDETITEGIADNYFRLGIVGMYVSNRKSEGFNDPNLHNVVSMVPDNGDMNNKPSQAIQQLGRNRGLDTTQLPTFTQITNHNVKPAFDVTLPAKTDKYYQPYFAAENKYKKHLITKLGVDAANSAMQWLIAETGASKTEEVSSYRFKFKIMKLLLLKMRILNNRNDHKIATTRKEFRMALRAAEKTIDKTIYKMNQPFTLPLYVQFIGNIIYGLTRMTRLRDLGTYIRFRFRTMRDRIVLRRQLKVGEPGIQARLAVTYGRMIQHHSLQNTFRNAMVSKQIDRALERKVKIISGSLQDRPFVIVKQESINSINTVIKNNLLPVLARFLPTDRQEELLKQALERKPDGWEEVIYSCMPVLEELAKQEENGNTAGVNEQLKILARGLFTAIPGFGPMVEKLELQDFMVKAEASKQVMLNMVNAMQHHDELESQISHYMKNDFLRHSCEFLPYQAYQTLQTVLLSGNNTEQFVKFLVATAMEGNVDMDFDWVHQTFIARFSPQYPELNAFSSFDQIKSNAENQALAIPQEVQGILTKYFNSTKPAEPQQNTGWISSALGFAANLVSDSRNLANLYLYKDNIIEELSVYFRTTFLDRCKHFLPYQEYHMLAEIITDNPELLATYLLANPDKLIETDLSNEQELMKIILDCYKEHPLVKNGQIKAFRNSEQIAQCAEEKVEIIANDLQKIQDDYVNTGIYEKLTRKLQSPEFCMAIADLIIVRNNNGHVMDLAKSTINKIMTKHAITISKAILNAMKNNDLSEDDVKMLFTQQLQTAFDTEYPELEYKVAFVDNVADVALNTLKNFNDNAIDHLDMNRVRQHMVDHLGELMLCKENADVINFTLRGLKRDDIAAILHKADQTKKNPVMGWAHYQQAADELLRFGHLINRGKKQALFQEFLNFGANPLPIGNQSADEIEDQLDHEYKATRAHRAGKSLEAVFEYLVESQMFYHRTTKKTKVRAQAGDSNLSAADHQQITDDANTEAQGRIYQIRTKRGERDVYMFNRLQAQSKSAKAAGRVCALADKNQIAALNSTKNHLFKPLRTLITGSKFAVKVKSAGLSISNAAARFATKFSSKPAPAFLGDQYPKEIAEQVRAATPLTYSQINDSLNANKLPPMDAVAPVLHEVKEDKKGTEIRNLQGKSIFARKAAQPQTSAKRLKLN